MVKCPPGCIPDPNYQPTRSSGQASTSKRPWPIKTQSDMKEHLSAPGLARNKSTTLSQNSVMNYVSRIWSVYRGRYPTASDVISDWSWLKKTTENSRYVEQRYANNSATQTSMFIALKIACKILGFTEPEAFYAVKSESVAKVRDEKEKDQKLNPRERKQMKTTRDFEVNISMLHELTTRLGQTWSASSPVRQDVFNRIWMALPIWMMLSRQEENAFRLENVYSPVLVDEKDKATIKQLEDAKRNYLVFPASKSNPVTFVMNTHKTVGTDTKRQGPLKYTLDKPELVKALVDSRSAYPRKYLLSQLNDSQTVMSESQASKFIPETYIVPVPADELRPTAGTVRTVKESLFMAKNPDIRSREQYAMRSGSSVKTIEQNYYKAGDAEFIDKLLKADKQRGNGVKLTAAHKDVIADILARKHKWTVVEAGSAEAEGRSAKRQRAQ